MPLSLQVSGSVLVKGRTQINMLCRPTTPLLPTPPLENIEVWERGVKKLERTFNKTLDEDVRIGVLPYLAPEKVAEHLYPIQIKE
eukprot:4292345-Amphidinium_carterae.1